MVDDDVSVAIEYGRIDSTAYMVWGDFMKEHSESVYSKWIQTATTPQE